MMALSQKNGYTLRYKHMAAANIQDIIQKVSKQDLTKYTEPKELTSLNQALWVLTVVKDNTDIKKLTAVEISSILCDLKEIHLQDKAIIRAFARCGSKVKTYKENGNVLYEIMAQGRDSLQNNSRINNNDILFFSGEHAWSDPNKNFPELIKKLDGELSILDPFYGNGTFFVLDKFGKNRKIRFLTCTLGKEEQTDENKFKINLNRFKKEFKNIELRKHSKPYELHDRYILADNAIVVIGHGIKDLASKESFVIFLPERLVSQFLPKIKKVFDERWSKASNLT